MLSWARQIGCVNSTPPSAYIRPRVAVALLPCSRPLHLEMLPMRVQDGT
jgi:hypothetical protein